MTDTHAGHDHRPGAWSTLVSPGVVAAHLDDPRWAIVDCRFELAVPMLGRELYEQAHVVGAVYADLDEDLSGKRTGTNGRHPLPAATAFAATAGRLGIGPGIQVVAYDQDVGMCASRLWWLLRWLGHEAVAVLDGGFAAWQAAGLPTQAGREPAKPRTFVAAAPRDWLALTTDVDAALGDPGTRLVDARAPERYRGDIEPLDPVAGHIPGAVNYHYLANLAPDGTFRAPADLRATYDELLAGVPASRAIVYCGSGVSACHDLLAMARAGLTGARLYAGSWSEWCADPRRPVETSASSEVRSQEGNA